MIREGSAFGDKDIEDEDGEFDNGEMDSGLEARL